MIYRVEYISECCDRHVSALLIADSIHNAFDIAFKVYGEGMTSISLVGGGEGRSGNEAPSSAPLLIVGSQKEGGDVYIRT